MTTQTQQNSVKYFDLHTHGVGYLNDIREVTPKKGNPFWACRIAALVGESENPEYRFFDCNIVGAEAETLIKKCIDAVTAEKKVLISFVLGDLWADTYVVSKDTKYHKKGDVAVALKSRLLRVKMIKINGELKYQEQPKSNNSDA
ncbi:STY4534 family ICE replication protein [Bisgaard Taxon 45]